ncbi:MAG: MazG family protein [Chloroflexi bacterium]|nr:MazG family protein [Chloroflexota bacterium]
MITIIGLGPGDPDLITRRTWRLLENSDTVFVRTSQHPAVAAVAQITHVQSYDSFYERYEDFAAVYAAIAADVVEHGRLQDVIYAVPGDPTVAEATTRQIRALAQAEGIEVEIQPGLSFLEPTFAALEQDPIAGIQIIDATTLAQMYHPVGATEQGVIAVQLYSRLLASDVKLTLMNAYPADHPVTLISGAGTGQMALRQIPLYALDRQDIFDDLTTLWVPPLPYAASYDALQEIIAHLRAPEGCPWDRKQTHESLRPYLLEETYEVLEALDEGDREALAEELGDLLIQVALHVQIATEENEFQLKDVISHVVEKLIRRHPHVFADVKVQDDAEVIRNWEAIKQAERKQAQAEHQSSAKKHLLDGMPVALPALALAQGYISRLSRVGYPLPSESLQQPEQLADALLQLVAIAHVSGLDAESSLRSACLRLRELYERLEAQLHREGKEITDLPPEKQQALWQDILAAPSPQSE